MDPIEITLNQLERIHELLTSLGFPEYEEYEVPMDGSWVRTYTKGLLTIRIDIAQPEE
jgi:hypothetical protein